MFIGSNRFAAAGLMAIALVVLAAGCSTDRPVAPAVPDSGVDGRIAAGTIPDEPGPPSEGTVVEGVSVPGIALGFTRAQVEQAYGQVTVWVPERRRTGKPGLLRVGGQRRRAGAGEFPGA